jgi:hypothetical protein
MIVSTVHGRVRIRARALRSGKAATRIAEELADLPGVVDARPNPGAGCLIMTFDPDAIDVTVLEERIESLCHAVERAPRNSNGRGLSRKLNQATKYGMLATLGTSLAYGYLGRKKAHIGFGAAFLALAGAHLFRYQGSLFR